MALPHQMMHYPADKYLGNQLRYPVDRDLSIRPRLFKSWIALSTGKITIKKADRYWGTNCIHWIEIYSVDSAF